MANPHPVPPQHVYLHVHLGQLYAHSKKHLNTANWHTIQLLKSAVLFSNIENVLLLLCPSSCESSMIT